MPPRRARSLYHRNLSRHSLALSNTFLLTGLQRHPSQTVHPRVLFFPNPILTHQRCLRFMARTSPKTTLLASSSDQSLRPTSKLGARRSWAVFHRSHKSESVAPSFSFDLTVLCSHRIPCIPSRFPVLVVIVPLLFFSARGNAFPTLPTVFGFCGSRLLYVYLDTKLPPHMISPRSRVISESMQSSKLVALGPIEPKRNVCSGIEKYIDGNVPKGAEVRTHEARLMRGHLVTSVLLISVNAESTQREQPHRTADA